MLKIKRAGRFFRCWKCKQFCVYVQFYLW